MVLKEIKGHVTYYPGCMSINVYPGIARSTLELLRLLSIDAKLPISMLCCGLPIGLLGIAKAEQMNAIVCFNVAKLMSNPDYIVVSCNGCYLALNKALSSEEFRRRYGVRARCLHVAELLWQSRHELARKVKRDMSKVKVAVHVGCHYNYALHGRALRGEEGEDILEDVALAFNSEVVDYEEKHSCCGAPAAKWIGHIMLELSQRKITSIIEGGADMILTMCPACMLILDKTQYELRQLEELTRTIPILHVSQFIALALGYDPNRIVGLHLHLSAQEAPLPGLLV